MRNKTNDNKTPSIGRDWYVIFTVRRPEPEHRQAVVIAVCEVVCRSLARYRKPVISQWKCNFSMPSLGAAGNNRPYRGLCVSVWRWFRFDIVPFTLEINGGGGDGVCVFDKPIGKVDQ